MRNPVFNVLLGDAVEQLRTLPDNHVHCIVTSPPYWGLRDYEVEGMIGLEQSWGEFATTMVAVFRELRRVLRPDGVCWLNMGDAFAQKGKTARHGQAGHPVPEQAEDCAADRHERLSYNTQAFSRQGAGWCRATRTSQGIGLSEKQLMLQPYRMAIALQEDGWWVRSDIKWRKPNVTPEGAQDRPHRDGEVILMLTKSPRYFYDNLGWRREGGKHARATWSIPVRKRSGVDHFATFPLEVPRRCILLSTSSAGCCEQCGAPVKRIVEPTAEYAQRLGKSWHDHKEDLKRGHRCGAAKFTGPTKITTGWEMTCDCRLPNLVPCRVLDPFSGSGTTGLAALELGRDYLGVELNPKYHAASLVDLAEAASKPQQLDLLGGVG